MARDYKAEYKNYHGTEKQKKERAGRNKARNLMIKKGSAAKGDGKDVDHKDRNPLNNTASNLRMQSKSVNRGRNK